MQSITIVIQVEEKLAAKIKAKIKEQGYSIGGFVRKILLAALGLDK